MISEGSCDTEDWRIDAKNLALHHRSSELHIQIYLNRKQLYINCYYTQTYIYY